MALQLANVYPLLKAAVLQFANIYQLLKAAVLQFAIRHHCLPVNIIRRRPVLNLFTLLYRMPIVTEMLYTITVVAVSNNCITGIF